MKKLFILPLLVFLLVFLLLSGCSSQLIDSLPGVGLRQAEPLPLPYSPAYLRVQYKGQTADISQSGWINYVTENGMPASFRETEKLNPFSLLTVDNPDADAFSLTFSRTPDILIENLYKDGILLKTERLNSLSPVLPTEDGIYEIEWIATYFPKDDMPDQGEMRYRLSLEIDQPATFSIQNPIIDQGSLFTLYAQHVNSGQTLYVTSPFYEGVVDFDQVGDRWIAFFPVDVATAAGTYELTMSTIEPATMAENKTTQKATVKAKEFPTQHLIVTDETLSLRTEENLKSDQAFIDSAVTKSSPTKLWDGAFLKSAEGYLTTEFGEIRFTNDNPIPRRHTGIDIANALDSPIIAANTGIVVMVQALNTTGITIILDHGLGIYTYYYHLNSTLVSLGDRVEKGELIAKMGTTGFSTGSHLHFSISKNNIVVNPWPFYETDPMDFK